MKKTLILTINIYQSFISAILKNVFGVLRMCRYSPTCSQYTKIQIEKFGIFRGLGKSTIRLLSCQPFIKL